MNRSDARPAAFSKLQSVARSLRCILVEPDEISQRNGKKGVFGGTEGIATKFVVKPSDDNGQAKRIKPGVQQGHVIGQGRDLLVLLSRDLLELGNYRGPHGHGRDPCDFVFDGQKEDMNIYEATFTFS